MLETMRPGIYTSYTVSAYGTGVSDRGLGIAGTSQITQTSVQKITSLGQAEELFGTEAGGSSLTRLIRAALENGAGNLYAVSAASADEAGYEQAVEKLLETEGVYTVCTPWESQELEEFLTGTLDRLEQEGKERLAVLGTGGTPEQAAAQAVRINHKRICLAYPKVTGGGEENLSPVLLGSMICREHLPASNLNGEMAQGEFAFSQTLTREQEETLMKSGVCLLEPMAGTAMLVRGLTTHTKSSSGLNDRTYRNISSVLILDQVVPALRDRLQGLLGTADNSPVSLDSIQSMTASRLEDFREQGLISSYQTPNVYLKQEDQTACVVEADFTVRQGLNQIYLAARISI